MRLELFTKNKSVGFELEVRGDGEGAVLALISLSATATIIGLIIFACNMYAGR